MDDNKSVTESGSTSTLPLPSMGLSNPRKLKLLKAERKLKQITKTYASPLLAAKTDPDEEPKLELIKIRMKCASIRIKRLSSPDINNNNNKMGLL